MHAISHSLPCRGPGASRARTRWQPYSATVTLPPPPALAPSRSPASYLHTPASSVSSSAPPTVYLNPVLDIDRFKPPPAAQLFQQSPLRDAHKVRYVTRLVDQAVKSLCDIWRPDDIPLVFSAPACAAEPPVIQRDSRFCPTTSNLFARNPQLPSPVSPSTQPSPFPPTPDSNVLSSQNAADISRNGHLVPMKTFVHEVLRRSRTSTGVLQTALCYLEAVRVRIPDVLQKEQAGSQREEEECEEVPRIVLGDIVSISEDVPSNITSVPPNLSPLPPLPPLPSPLLCPRRTFLACLILASKFMQDRSYSNRAWAKLAGLPPREIGRCERAVGDALGWRLWVGKGMSTSTAGGSANGGRTVTRSRSDGDLLNGPSNRAAVWSSPAAEDPTGASCRHSRCDHPAAALPTPAQTPASQSRRLCRCATEPAIVHELACASTSHAPRFPSRSAAPLAGIVEDCQMFLVEPCATPAACGATVDAQQDEDFSPSMLTPTLSYSPMSTASSASSDSSGDRTIQMSAFADLPTPSLTSFAYAHYSGVWDNSGIVDSNFNSVSWQAKGKATLDGMMTQMEDVSPGPTSATINTSETRRLPYSLPSLSDTVSLAPNHDGLYNCWTK